MRNFQPKFTAPTVFLYVYVIVTQVVGGLYEAAEVEPHPALVLIGPFGFFWALACWFQRDIYSRGLRWAIDLGFFLYIGWLVLLPYYLFKTRGPRAALVILTFVLVYVSSLAAGVTLFVLFGIGS